MQAWLRNAVYLLVVLAASPWLIWSAFRRGKYRTGWNQKLWGQVPLREGTAPCVWMHAVSVGEVLQLQSIVTGWRARHPDWQIVISTTTTTGYDVAVKKYPDCRVIYYPLDFSWAVQSALNRIRPDLVALVELELWPNFVEQLSRRQIPITVINGRLSERSARGYRWIRPVMRQMLSRLSEIAVQSQAYADRFIDLGADPRRVTITGSIKFDGVQTHRGNPKTVAIRESFGLQPQETVFVAGSTQAPEEQLAIETWLALRSAFPDLRLLLVPRHKERFEEVAELVRGTFQLPLLRRSELLWNGKSVSTAKSDSASAPVLLLDTLGELAAAWGLADVAFVGGSLSTRGGQNMIEPAAYGATVMFGPNTQNFRDVVSLLLSHQAATVVRSGADLKAEVTRCLTQPDAARQQGARAQQLVLAQQGATQRTLDRLDRCLSVSTGNTSEDGQPDADLVRAGRSRFAA